MLVATMTILLLVFGVGGGADITILEILDTALDAVNDIVKDEDRLGRVRSELTAMKAGAEAFNDEVQKGRRKILALDLDYGTTREQYVEAFRALDTAWEAAEARALDRVMTVREQMTMDEWRTLFIRLGKMRD